MQNPLWFDVYAFEPLNGTRLTAAEEARVIGAEVSLWGEEIDGANLQYKSWPRAAAFAERMWSPRDARSPYEAAPRLARMVCKFKARGVAASPISPGSCFALRRDGGGDRWWGSEL